jgi:transcriptional regulator with XRE-family HTH domain
MSTIEERLKELILSKYKTVSDFAKSIDIPYTTVDSILKRGVQKANVVNIIKICKALGISTDELAEGRIMKVSDGVVKEVSQNIAFYRKQRGTTQEELANKIDVTPSLLNKWETGEKAIDMDTLHEICDILDVDMMDMLGKFGTYREPTYSAEEKNIVLKVRKLNSDGKKYILRQFDYALQQDEYLLKRKNSKEA